MDSIRQIVIVPNENKINSGIYRRNLTNSEAHGLGVYEFSNKYNLGLSCKSLGLTDDDFHDIHWFIELAKMGHLVIQKDEDIIIYLPPTITRNQYRYLLENRSGFQNYNRRIHVLSLIYEDGTFYQDSIGEIVDEYENTPFDLLYEKIKEKYIPSNNSYALIIPNENSLKIENGLYLKEFDSNILEGHGKIYKEFCELYHINVSLTTVSGYFWGQSLSNMGMMSIIKEDDEIYLFLPNKLSNNQFRWLLDKKDYLMNFSKIEADIINGNKHQLIYLEDNSSKEKLIKDLYDIILMKAGEVDGTLFKTGNNHTK